MFNEMGDSHSGNLSGNEGGEGDIDGGFVGSYGSDEVEGIIIAGQEQVIIPDNLEFEIHFLNEGGDGNLERERDIIEADAKDGEDPAFIGVKIDTDHVSADIVGDETLRSPKKGVGADTPVLEQERTDGATKREFDP